MRQLIGNDIVDLTSDYALLKSQNERFVRRVFAESEFENLARQKNTEDQDLFLWCSWTAKEATYKVIKKLKPETPFSHSKFIVENLTLKTLKNGHHDYGIVRYEGTPYPVLWESNPSYIHCLALSEGKFEHHGNLSWQVVTSAQMKSTNSPKFSKEEEISIYSEESRLVRSLAKGMLQARGLRGVEIIRRPLGKNRFLPPILSLDYQELTDWDISMSHDGGFLACGITCPNGNTC